MSGAKILFGLLVHLLPASFPILIVVDDTIERRRGKNKARSDGHLSAVIQNNYLKSSISFKQQI